VTVEEGRRQWADANPHLSAKQEHDDETDMSEQVIPMRGTDAGRALFHKTGRLDAIALEPGGDAA
jgi:hypothetical protein